MFSVCGNDVDLLVESVCMSVCVMSEGEHYLRRGQDVVMISTALCMMYKGMQIVGKCYFTV